MGLTPFQDKLINLVAGIGNNRDKTSYTRHESRTLDKVELLALYRDNWVAGKAVDIFSEDMVRKWRSYKGDRKQIAEIIKEENRIMLKPKIAEAIKWSRLYGGAALVPIFIGDTNESVRKPLDIESIKKGSLSKIIAVDNTIINPSGMIQNDPFKDNYGQPASYTINGNVNNIHFSRVFRFHGVDLPYFAQQHNNYWGDSVIQRMYDTINNAGTTFSAVAQMMLEMVTDVIKIPQLSALLTTKEETDKMIERFNLMKLLGSISQLKILDKEEEYERHQIQLSGTNDIITQYLTMVSAAANIPVTRFIGTSPRGMNATGESDLEIHYENVHSKQDTELRPILDTLDKIIQMHLFGSLIEEYSYEFLPLYMQDDKEISETKKVNADERKVYVDMGVLPKHTVAKQLNEEGWSIDNDYISKLESVSNDPSKLAPTTAGETVEPVGKQAKKTVEKVVSK